MKQTNRLVAADACHMFTAVLLSLQIHGEHEGNQAALISLALQTYELLVRSMSLTPSEDIRSLNKIKFYDEFCMASVSIYEILTGVSCWFTQKYFSHVSIKFELFIYFIH